MSEPVAYDPINLSRVLPGDKKKAPVKASTIGIENQKKSDTSKIITEEELSDEASVKDGSALQTNQKSDDWDLDEPVESEDIRKLDK